MEKNTSYDVMVLFNQSKESIAQTVNDISNDNEIEVNHAKDEIIPNNHLEEDVNDLKHSESDDKGNTSCIELSKEKNKK